jgi:hypothetical protein
MRETRTVSHGVDTFNVNAYYLKGKEPIKAELNDHLATDLEAWKKHAQLDREPYATPWNFNGRTLLMQPNGAGGGQWPWMCKTRDITLYLSNGKWNGVASVRFNASYLWSCSSFLDALVPVHSLLRTIFQNEMHLQPSGVDLCADVANWQDINTMDRRRNFVSRSRKRGEHHEADWPRGMKHRDFSSGLQETGFDFSKRGAMAATIYDKTREVRASEKEWFFDLWRLQSGWKEEEEPSVWRVEMKFKRQALHELKQGDVFHGIEDAYDLPARFPVLWAYAAGHVDGGDDGLPDGWLRCVTPTDDTNRARWPTHPSWKVVQQAFTDPQQPPPHFGKIIRKRQEDFEVERALEAILGYSTSLSAHKGGKLAQPDVDLSVFLHWLAVNGADLLARRGKDFSTEIQRKRIQLGLEKKPPRQRRSKT